MSDSWVWAGGNFPPGAPVSCARSDNGQTLQLFVSGNDGRIYNTSGAGTSWSGNWQSIGGFFPVGAPVTAINRGEVYIDLFVCGSDNRIYTSTWDGGSWSGVEDNWRCIGGSFPAQTIAAVALDESHIDVVVSGFDGRVYKSTWDGSTWSGEYVDWTPISTGYFPTEPQPAPVTVIYPNSQPSVFVCGGDGRVYRSFRGGSEDQWSGANDDWASIGGFFFNSPNPVPRIAGIVPPYDEVYYYLFICGNDGGIYYSVGSPDGNWSGSNDSWTGLGGSFPPGSPITVAFASNQIHVFVSGEDGGVYASKGFNDWSEWTLISGVSKHGWSPVTAISVGPSNTEEVQLVVCGDDGNVYTTAVS
jgi:hypothetical protein